MSSAQYLPCSSADLFSITGFYCLFPFDLFSFSQVESWKEGCRRPPGGPEVDVDVDIDSGPRAAGVA